MQAYLNELFDNPNSFANVGLAHDLGNDPHHLVINQFSKLGQVGRAIGRVQLEQVIHEFGHFDLTENCEIFDHDLRCGFHGTQIEQMHNGFFGKFSFDVIRDQLIRRHGIFDVISRCEPYFFRQIRLVLQLTLLHHRAILKNGWNESFFFELSDFESTGKKFE